MKKVLFFTETGQWEVPSGVDYCTARICGGGGGGGESGTPTAGANSAVSYGGDTYSGVGGDPVSISYMGYDAACHSGRESSGQSAFFASGRIYRRFTALIPAAVNEFGINLEPGETVTITVGAGGAQGYLVILVDGADIVAIPDPGGPSTANGGSGFVNIEYWI